MEGQDKKNVREDNVDFFTQLMFGRPAKNSNSNESNQFDEKKDKKQNGSLLNEENLPIPQWLKNIDYEEVFNHVDTIVSSAKELKPLIKKINPMLETIMQKNSKF